MHTVKAATAAALEAAVHLSIRMTMSSCNSVMSASWIVTEWAAHCMHAEISPTGLSLVKWNPCLFSPSVASLPIPAHPNSQGWHSVYFHKTDRQKCYTPNNKLGQKAKTLIHMDVQSHACIIPYFVTRQAAFISLNKS